MQYVLIIGVTRCTLYSLVLCSLSSFIGVRQAQAKEWGGGGGGGGQISEGGL